ncbi:MAG: GAF domain-containing sensor histidine kinase [Candidatus Promineifilaceae bacterium]|nr:GAF domain-containing sensor histidine kinase [Candidatus Promineifilaceae bacterium]
MTEQTPLPQQRLAVLSELSARLGSTLDRGELVHLVMDAALELTGAERGFLILHDDVTGDLQAVAAHNVDKETLEDETMKISRTVVERAISSGEPVLADNAQEDKHFVRQQGSEVPQLRSIMCAPLRARDQTLGAAYVESRLPGNAFVEEDLNLLAAFASQAALAVENTRLYTELEQAHEAKSQFVSLVTHELRIPMTSIRGYADLLLGGLAGALTPSQTEFLNTIRRNLDRMSALLNALSDINRIESGRMHFEHTRFDLREVVHDVAEDLSEKIRDREQELHLEIPTTFPLVYADRVRTRQALSNLLNNAHKYTPSGGEIAVSVQQEEGRARVDVADTGIGISKADQARLFTQFFRAEDEAVREETGWGLGLSIVKLLVEAQGGDVDFESEPGAGSTFSFTLPLATDHKGEAVDE